MPTPNKSATTATTNGVNDSNEMPMWDTSDTGRATHIRLLETYLSAKHPECATLVEFGYVISKDTVCCMSTNHVDRIRQERITLPGSWLDPLIISRSDTAPTRPRLTDEDVGCHKVQPEQVELADHKLLGSILETIDDPRTRQQRDGHVSCDQY